MHFYLRWNEAGRGYGFFSPEYDVITSAVLVIAKITVKANDRYITGLQQFNGFFRPTDLSPAVRRHSLIIQEDFHIHQAFVACWQQRCLLVSFLRFFGRTRC